MDEIQCQIMNARIDLLIQFGGIWALMMFAAIGGFVFLLVLLGLAGWAKLEDDQAG